MRGRILAVAAVTMGLLSTPASAAEEEIQVYMDELNAPGVVGLDLHNNYVLGGSSALDYLGQQQSLHRYRFTPEWSLGLTHSLELGVYLPLATIDRHGLFVDGIKLRLKYLAPRSEGQRWFWGANFEIGKVGHRLDQNPYNAELKGILGIHAGKWTAAANANFDFKVSGPAPAPGTLEIATKLNYALSPKTAIGIENYNGAGEIRDLGRFASSDQAAYLTVDTSVGKWDLNFGLGRGYGSNPDKWIAKAIVSVPLDWSLNRRLKAH
jgi:hypothetical protein